MNTATATKQHHSEYHAASVKIDIKKLVTAASQVIVPYGPISTFAARHPWVGFEQQSFAAAARKIKAVCDVDILPNEAIIRTAWEKGEIEERFLDLSLERWLDAQALDLPREVCEQYCRNALKLKQTSSNPLATDEIMSISKELSRFQAYFPVRKVVQSYSQLCDQQHQSNIVKELDRHMIKWCKLFLDESHAVWSLPDREKGFYNAWRKLVQLDPALPKTIRQSFKSLPERAEEALAKALSELDIPFSDIQEYLESHLLALPGWAGMMLWRSQQSHNSLALLTEYLAVRLLLEYTFLQRYLPLKERTRKQRVQLEELLAYWHHWGDIPLKMWSQLSHHEIKARLTLANQFDVLNRQQLWLEAWEKTYEHQLQRMVTKQELLRTEKTAPLAQFVFCIDVRSEPFRRKLEKAGPFATFGTAGFFGLPIETCELGGTHTHPSLPVLFKPQYHVKEAAPDTQLLPYKQRLQAAYIAEKTLKTMKHQLLTSMVLPELTGPWLSLQTVARSFIPSKTGKVLRKLKESWLGKPAADLTLEQQTSEMESSLPIGFTSQEQVHYVRQALTMMGMTKDFAPLVIICGHGSRSTNNPYASALDCGACGGASSGFNARVLATLCNIPEVRTNLKNAGIVIPDDTVFAAAEHITTIDELHWLYVPELSQKAKQAFAEIEKALPSVTEEANAERMKQLADSFDSRYPKNAKGAAEVFAEDWSEVRPEWGLARNAAFIIGDRVLTQECNLAGRTFLHNYHWQKDRNGDLLSAIISGPVTVAQWINLQYYASTVAPHYYGSGNKATQTITAGIGVMQGNASDLMLGLPWQSVMESDQSAYHAPLRLLVVIHAPKEYVERLLHHHHDFQQKVQNGWIRLASLDPEGQWQCWS
ncbi:DUF2309 domain-containing protein [Bacillus rubiinfantis]|uniref:DUF2309 domain-containing protein n=1 Tax=Bacillus rubiinfantis TaxID=1499680 RepID=UPI0005AAFE59|nr:putative inorganic carbon transporter subunit DabA [Bacillus rubiinfantis]